MESLASTIPCPLRFQSQSCDVYFYDLANKMGIDNLHDGLKPFNFGAITGIDILFPIMNILNRDLFLRASSCIFNAVSWCLYAL
jgi:hypothetical protein